jgi:hypothetical protein
LGKKGIKNAITLLMLQLIKISLVPLMPLKQPWRLYSNAWRNTGQPLIKLKRRAMVAKPGEWGE